MGTKSDCYRLPKANNETYKKFYWKQHCHLGGTLWWPKQICYPSFKWVTICNTITKLVTDTTTSEQLNIRLSWKLYKNNFLQKSTLLNPVPTFKKSIAPKYPSLEKLWNGFRKGKIGRKFGSLKNSNEKLYVCSFNLSIILTSFSFAVMVNFWVKVILKNMPMWCDQKSTVLWDKRRHSLKSLELWSLIKISK